MRQWALAFVSLVALSGCGGNEDGAREVPVSNRPKAGPSRTQDVTRPAKAIATH